MRRIISVLMENTPGGLSRVVGLFSQRGYNIESLTVAPTHDETLSRVTLVSFGDADKIHSLPGFDQPLPSDWYSGYLEYDLEGRQVHTHYVLVRAENNDEDTKPLVRRLSRI